jgi:hypothetical protein
MLDWFDDPEQRRPTRSISTFREAASPSKNRTSRGPGFSGGSQARLHALRLFEWCRCGRGFLGRLRRCRLCGWMRGGPILPIEFSRISGGERLTLVIDEECGTRVPTRYALSADINVTSARESLGNAPQFPPLRNGCQRQRVFRVPIWCPSRDAFSVLGFVGTTFQRPNSSTTRRHATSSVYG